MAALGPTTREEESEAAHSGVPGMSYPASSMEDDELASPPNIDNTPDVQHDNEVQGLLEPNGIAAMFSADTGMKSQV